MRGFEGRITVAVAITLFVTVAARAADDTPKNEKPKEPPAVVTASQQGFTIQSEDGSFKLRLTGYAQADGRFYASDANQDGADAFTLRRVRPIVAGTVGRFFDFNITPDFGGGTASVQDAFLDARFSSAFRVKAGKFKGPVGLERLQSGAALTFVERGLPTDLVPNRDLGVQVHGELAGGRAAYQLGVFDGAIDGGSVDGDLSDGKDLEGRLFLQPFRNGSSRVLAGLGFGIAGTNGRQLGPVPAYKTIGQLTFFSYASTVSADGTRTRIAPQASYQNGPFRVFGEWVQSRQELRRTPSDSLRVTNRVWQAVGSCVLTGEAPAAGVVAPKIAFDPARRAWGALELAARYGVLDVDGAVFASGYADPTKSARRARSWGIGVNWYLTRNVKYVANFDHTTFEGGAPAGADRKPENAILFRAQVSF